MNNDKLTIEIYKILKDIERYDNTNFIKNIILERGKLKDANIILNNKINKYIILYNKLATRYKNKQEEFYLLLSDYEEKEKEITVLKNRCEFYIMDLSEKVNKNLARIEDNDNINNEKEKMQKEIILLKEIIDILHKKLLSKKVLIEKINKDNDIIKLRHEKQLIKNDKDNIDENNNNDIIILKNEIQNLREEKEKQQEEFNLLKNVNDELIKNKDNIIDNLREEKEKQQEEFNLLKNVNDELIKNKDNIIDNLREEKEKQQEEFNLLKNINDELIKNKDNNIDNLKEEITKLNDIIDNKDDIILYVKKEFEDIKSEFYKTIEEKTFLINKLNDDIKNLIDTNKTVKIINTTENKQDDIYNNNIPIEEFLNVKKRNTIQKRKTDKFFNDILDDIKEKQDNKYNIIICKPKEEEQDIIKPNETITDIIKPNETIKDIIKPNETITDIIKPNETITDIIKPNETIKDIIKPNENIFKQHGGRNINNNKQIVKIDNILKMYIDGNITTLTEQELDQTNKQKINTIYMRKYQRQNRQKNANN